MANVVGLLKLFSTLGGRDPRRSLTAYPIGVYGLFATRNHPIQALFGVAYLLCLLSQAGGVQKCVYVCVLERRRDRERKRKKEKEKEGARARAE